MCQHFTSETVTSPPPPSRHRRNEETKYQKKLYNKKYISRLARKRVAGTCSQRDLDIDIVRERQRFGRCTTMKEDLADRLKRTQLGTDQNLRRVECVYKCDIHTKSVDAVRDVQWQGWGDAIKRRAWPTSNSCGSDGEGEDDIDAKFDFRQHLPRPWIDLVAVRSKDNYNWRVTHQREFYRRVRAAGPTDSGGRYTVMLHIKTQVFHVYV